MRRKMKLIYIASPFSHEEKGVRFKRFKEITYISAQLHKKFGYAMFLPITQSYMMQEALPEIKGDFETWKEVDLFMVGLKCDEVWIILMEGWKESKGVQAEIHHARALNKRLRYIDPLTLDFVKEPKERKRSVKDSSTLIKIK